MFQLLHFLILAVQKKDLKSPAFLLHSPIHAIYLIKIHVLDCSFTETLQKLEFLSPCSNYELVTEVYLSLA